MVAKAALGQQLAELGALASAERIQRLGCKAFGLGPVLAADLLVLLGFLGPVGPECGEVVGLLGEDALLNLEGQRAS
jgi:hypothetical protein